MRLRFLALLAVCTALGLLAACQKEQAADYEATSTTDTSPASETPASSAANPVSADDQTFVTAVGQAGMTEVESGGYAGSNSSNADVKQFGALMVTQHTELGKQLSDLSANNGFTFPTEVGPSNQQLLDQLTKLSGSEFDNTYVNAMVEGHTQAVQLFENASKTAQNPDLKAWATQTLPEIQMHLEKAQALAATLK